MQEFFRKQRDEEIKGAIPKESDPLHADEAPASDEDSGIKPPQ